MSSPFLTPTPTAQPDSLAILHLRRDTLIATTLQEHDSDDDGYDEGKVTNTRFGSYPHSTLLLRPWGSQILASAVDTGSRGRRSPTSTLKRKALLQSGSLPLKSAVTASSGFAHLLPPTPESWTSSLPHRTQVVYTPDYSYVLQRLRVRPGGCVIEAGAGSGSFTHAAARAVFSGYGGEDGARARKKRKLGKVFSFEFHEQRVEKLKNEIQEHGLRDIVTVTHRDVYNDGFALGTAEGGEEPQPKANAVFLDLPAPWLALKHLRRLPSHTQHQSTDPAEPVVQFNVPSSPLDPSQPIHLCTFSPCLEQVQRTISALHAESWTEIEMVELSQRRIEVRRERIGLHEEGLRGVSVAAASVGEAVRRLKDVEKRSEVFHEHANANGSAEKGKGNSDRIGEEEHGDDEEEEGAMNLDTPTSVPLSQPSIKRQRLDQIKDTLPSRKLFKEGRLVHRSEPELKTHTSYLVFAVLPREWTEEDEERCAKRWPAKVELPGGKGKSRRQMKRERQREERNGNEGQANEEAGDRLAEDRGSEEN